MVDRQPTLCNVHGPQVDQPLRRSLQPHLHLRTLTLALGSRADFLSFLKSPSVVGFSLVALVFTMYHAATWFYLLGAISPVKIGRSTTKPWQALVLNLLLLVIVSYLAIWLLVLRWRLRPTRSRGC